MGVVMRGEGEVNPYTWGVWPEPPHVRDLRAQLAAIAALCAAWRAKDGKVPCALLEKELDR